MEVYETRHVYYIVKEKFEEKLPGVLEKAIEQLRKTEQKGCSSMSWRRESKSEAG